MRFAVLVKSQCKICSLALRAVECDFSALCTKHGISLMTRPRCVATIVLKFCIIVYQGCLVSPSGAAPQTQGKLYWSNFMFGTIESANVDGTGRQIVVSGLGDPRGVEFDIQAGQLY